VVLFKVCLVFDNNNASYGFVKGCAIYLFCQYHKNRFNDVSNS